MVSSFQVCFCCGPANSTLPLLSVKVRGYSPKFLLAPGFGSMVPWPPKVEGGLKISSVLFWTPPGGTSLRPPLMIVRPSGSSVWVGYQRPFAMLGCCVHVSLKGSKVKIVCKPANLV